MIESRKLAAIDIALLGSRFVILEFAGGVVFSLALGVFVLSRAASAGQTALALYLVSLGLNYVPMLAAAADLARKGSARAELGDELKDKRLAMAKYRRQSLYLLVPLLVVAVALRHHRRATTP